MVLVLFVCIVWWQDLVIVIELVMRFYLLCLYKDICFLLFNMFERVIVEDEVLLIIFGGQLFVDCGFMLKVCFFFLYVEFFLIMINLLLVFFFLVIGEFDYSSDYVYVSV